MKVLHIIPSISPLRGGTTTTILALSKALKKQGVAIEIATTNDCLSNVPLNQMLDYQEIPTIVFRKMNECPKFLAEYGLSFNFNQWLYSHIKSYDLIHFHSFFSYLCTSGALIARLKKVKYIMFPQGQLDAWVINRKKIKKLIYSTLLEKHNLNHASAIHCTTQLEAQDVKKFGIKSPSFILPLGITSSVTILDAKLQICKMYKICPTTPIILFFSRFHPKKNIELLLYACQHLAKQSDFHLILAGSGDQEYTHYIHDLVVSLNLQSHTTFSGFVQGENKAILLEGSDIFVLPSKGENFGIAVAEAMASKLPVIVTPAVQISPDIQSYQAGLVIPEQVSAWEEAIQTLLASKQLRQRMGENGQNLVKTKYDWNVIGHELKLIYQSLINDKISPLSSHNMETLEATFSVL